MGGRNNVQERDKYKEELCNAISNFIKEFKEYPFCDFHFLCYDDCDNDENYIHKNAFSDNVKMEYIDIKEFECRNMMKKIKENMDYINNIDKMDKNVTGNFNQKYDYIDPEDVNEIVISKIKKLNIYDIISECMKEEDII